MSEAEGKGGVYRASLGAQMKNPPAMQKTLVQFLSQEDPLEKEMARILTWTEEVRQRSLVSDSSRGRKELQLTD